MTITSERDVRFVSVFAAGPDGGNPAPIVIDAAGIERSALRENDDLIPTLEEELESDQDGSDDDE